MKKKIIYIVIIVVIIVVVGFLSYESLKNERLMGEQGNKLEKVSLRLKWVDQAQFAGYYLTKSQGLYERKGLEVEISPGGPDISPAQMVAAGVNNFGITGADQIILVRAKGVPLVALAVLYKDSPVTILSLKEKGIESPKDLEGKKVAVVYGRDEEVIYRALLAKEGVDSSKIDEVPSMPSPTEVIYSVDARVGYELNCPILLNLMGYEVNLIKPRDYGIRFYGDTLFTTEKMIKENPELVRNFVKASIDGWKMALQNPEMAIDEVLKINSTLNREHQSRFLAASVPIIIGRGEIGYSEKKVWEEIQDTLIAQGMLKDAVDIDKVFTNEFLK
ncbi:ABC transporter substrate-binding protein [Patescibacteria group bacterium]|nr:ABC transporter substrate-binding protein [Patescibacteria group bacterium]MBU4367814.1 ABC transporter substrate-binding protein [Patescibacteria group bacterium]MBU4461524.1 ABC transporter substrate-binding protein [Patescibacteria group bacterium]MCG2700335.1 ABC transporter substrate-binding protein [Candidatus Parcubacteria bacterium]